MRDTVARRHPNLLTGVAARPRCDRPRLPAASQSSASMLGSSCSAEADGSAERRAPSADPTSSMLTTHRREVSVGRRDRACSPSCSPSPRPATSRAENLSDLFLASLPVLIVALGATLVILTGEIDISVGSVFAICGVARGRCGQGGRADVRRARRRVRRAAPRSARSTARSSPTCGCRRSSSRSRRWWRCATRCAGRPRARGCRTCRPAFQWLGLSQAAYPIRRARCCGRPAGADGVGRRATWRPAARSTRPARTPMPHAWPASTRAFVKWAVFTTAGALTGLAALLNSVRFNQIPSNAGLGLEMKVIAAVVVGGTAIRGGRGTFAGTLLGVILLGAIGPALTFLGVNAYWERAHPGRDHPHGGWRSTRGAIGRPTHTRARLPRERAPDDHAVAQSLVAEWRMAAARVALAGEIALFAAVAQNFFTVGNFFEVTRLSVELGLLAVALTPVIIAAASICRSARCSACRRWCSGRRSKDFGLPLPLAAASAADRRRRGRRAQRRADRPPRDSAAHRHAGIAVAVPRHRRRHHPRGGQLHRLSARLPRARPGLPAGRHSGAAAALRRWCWPDTSYCCTARSSAARCMPSGSRRPARATPGFRSAAGRAGVPALGAGVQPGGDRLRRASGSGAVGCRQRLRARCDHGRRAGRHVGVRRARARSGARCSACSRSRCCATGCSSRRCRPSWRAC